MSPPAKRDAEMAEAEEEDDSDGVYSDDDSGDDDDESDSDSSEADEDVELPDMKTMNAIMKLEQSLEDEPAKWALHNKLVRLLREAGLYTL
jgi:hypothetical protein